MEVYSPLDQENMFVFHYDNMTTSINSHLQNDNAVKIYPNPFTNTTTIEFKLEEIKNTSLSIIDVTGRLVKIYTCKTLLQEKINPLSISPIYKMAFISVYFKQIIIYKSPN